MKNEQIVIPSSLRNYILQKLHTSHRGVEKSIARARKTIYWPEMTSNIKEKILKCNKCLKYRNHNQKQPLVQHEIPDLPRQNIDSNIFQYEGKIYLLAGLNLDKNSVRLSNPALFYKIMQSFILSKTLTNSFE